jgi:hypothetical protein
MGYMNQQAVVEALTPASAYATRLTASLGGDTRETCDRCGVKAAAAVALESGFLTFCAHHARAYAPEVAALTRVHRTRLAHRQT